MPAMEKRKGKKIKLKKIDGESKVKKLYAKKVKKLNMEEKEGTLKSKTCTNLFQ